MVRSVIYYVGFVLFFSVGHYNLMITRISGGTGIKSDVTQLYKDHDLQDFNPNNHDRYSDLVGAGDDDDGIDDCLEECREDFLICIARALGVQVGSLASAIAACAAAGGPSGIVLCVLGILLFTDATAGIVECAIEVDECREECRDDIS